MIRRPFRIAFAGAALAIATSAAVADTDTVITSFPKELTSAYKAAFEKANPGITLEILNKSTVAGIAFVRETAAGQRPDFKGYWQQPEKTKESFTADGWFKTGDLGYLDVDGYLTLCGRSKDLIISGGLNIYPPEVERVLMEHPAVEACAVIGCPDPEWGERVTAFIVPRAGQTIDPESLKSFLKNRLSPFKVPKESVVVRELPKSQAGKLLKRELRGKYTGKG